MSAKRTKKPVTLPPRGSDAFVTLAQVEVALATSRGTVWKIRTGQKSSPVPFPEPKELPWGLRWRWADIEQYIKDLAEAAQPSALDQFA